MCASHGLTVVSLLVEVLGLAPAALEHPEALIAKTLLHDLAKNDHAVGVQEGEDFRAEVPGETVVSSKVREDLARLSVHAKRRQDGRMDLRSAVSRGWYASGVSV